MKRVEGWFDATAGKVGDLIAFELHDTRWTMSVTINR